MPRRTLPLGLFLLAASLAPAPQNPPVVPQNPPVPPIVSSPAEIRVKAAIKAFDMAWLYYSENRVPSEKVYRWSKRLLESRREASGDRSALIAAAEEHLERMKKLEAKIQRIRKIGFGDSLDVLEVDYYRKEADFWLSEAKAGR